MEINIRETQRKTRMDNPDEQSTVGIRHKKRRQNRKKKKNKKNRKTQHIKLKK